MALLIIGFLSAIGGFILLVMGGFQMPGRTKIANSTARSAGVLFLLYFPLVVLANHLVARFELQDQIDIVIVYWVLLGCCVLSATIVLLRALTGTQPVRRGKARGAAVRQPASSAFADPVEPAAPVPAPRKRAPTSKPQPPQAETDSGSPFDFS